LQRGLLLTPKYHVPGTGISGRLAVPYNATWQTGLHHDFKDFEGVVTDPRFAFAYSPRGDGRTVIRGAVGLFANTIQGSITAVFGNPPNKFTHGERRLGLAGTSGSAASAATSSSQGFQTCFAQGETLPEIRATLPSGTTSATPTLYVTPDDFHTIKVLEWSAELEQPVKHTRSCKHLVQRQSRL
jgi:hypothetical protein